MKVLLFVSLAIQGHGYLERPRRVKQIGSFEVVDDDAMKKEERDYQDGSSFLEVNSFQRAYVI